jgi:ABC-type Na+ efflux pump permease subunit
MKSAFIICRKELKEVMRDKKMVIPFFTFPVVLLAAFIFVLRDIINNPSALEQIIGKLLPGFMMIQGIVAAAFSLGIAVESFVGEKERKTFEPLLATPISDGELFLGKCMAATLMPISAAYIMEFLFFGMMAFQFARAHLQFTVPVGNIIFIAALIPVIALMMCALASIVSTLSSTVKGAAQITSFVIIPFIIFFQRSGSKIMASDTSMLLTIAIIGGVDALMLYIGSRIFQREKLISSL